MLALLRSPVSVLKARRGARAAAASTPAPPSPAFLGLLASPPPRPQRRGGAAAGAPTPQRAALRVLRRVARVPRGVLPFLAGVLLATLLFATAPPPDATVAGGRGNTSCHAVGGAPGDAPPGCEPSDSDALRAALAATRGALGLWRVALAPAAGAAAHAALLLALRAARAARAVPPVAYAAACLALVALAAALAAWRALSLAAASVARAASRRTDAAHAAFSRRYAALHAALARRSRAAAVALPHVAVLGGTAAALAAAPQTLSAAALSPAALLAATLALPLAASLAALRASREHTAATPPDARPARRWLAYWCALAPFLVAAEAPLVSTLASAAPPAARAAWLAALAWALAPATRGAERAAAALAPRLAPLGVRVAAAPRASRAAALVALLPGVAATLRIPPGVVTAAAAVLRNATPALLLSGVFFVTPGALTRYGALLAGVLCPAASSLAALRAAPAAPAYERGWLLYWIVYVSALCVAATPPAAAALRWLPLAQHARLAAVLWLQLFGGAARAAHAAAHALAAALGEVRSAAAHLAPERRAAAAAAAAAAARRARDDGAGDDDGAAEFTLRRLAGTPGEVADADADARGDGGDVRNASPPLRGAAARAAAAASPEEGGGGAGSTRRRRRGSGTGSGGGGVEEAAAAQQATPPVFASAAAARRTPRSQKSR
jgi:hypothetical protein